MKTYSKNFPAVFLLVMIAMLFLNFGSYAQTYEKYYQDGQLYVKFKDSYNPQIVVQADKSVKMQDATYFRDIMDKYDVTAISRPIDIDDPKLLRTFANSSFCGIFSNCSCANDNNFCGWNARNTT